MRKFTGSALIILAIISLSCESTRKTAAGSALAERKNVACADQLKESSQPHLDWIIESNSVLDNVSGLTRPVSYKVYSLDSMQLRAFFHAGKDANGKQQKISSVVPLPAPYECKTFVMGESNAMSPQLREKYPDIVSLKGSDETGQADARLDYDGKRLRGQIMWGGKVYLVSPVTTEGKHYYMVYERSDSGDKKEPFEEMKSRSSMQKARYDK